MDAAAKAARQRAKATQQTPKSDQTTSKQDTPAATPTTTETTPSLLLRNSKLGNRRHTRAANKKGEIATT